MNSIEYIFEIYIYIHEYLNIYFTVLYECSNRCLIIHIVFKMLAQEERFYCIKFITSRFISENLCLEIIKSNVAKHHQRNFLLITNCFSYYNQNYTLKL